MIQRSLQLDKEREEMSRTFQQYQNAYYEKSFNENEDELGDEEEEDNPNAKVSNEFEVKILKQCYEALEKTLENTEKEKENFQVG